MEPILYGDGVHDDAPAIQALLDTVRNVTLPMPNVHYCIRSTLILHDNCSLTLPRFAHIRLDEGANCPMVANELTPDPDESRTPQAYTPLCQHLWSFVRDYSPTAICHNIALSGGIWDCNNREQLPNPEQSGVYEPHGYTGDGMLFYGVENLTITDLTLQDPVHYGITLDRVSYFTIENITFDYRTCNPIFLNMDGIHCNGNCHFGHIRNLQGACYDDLVALNAHEGSKGPITNISIDGVYATDCHSAARLLTVSDTMQNIHISNVYGTYYCYCLGLTKYYPGETTGFFDGITFDHIYAAKSKGTADTPDRATVPLLFIQSDTHTKNLYIHDLVRDEHALAVPTISIGEKAVVENLVIQNVTTTNHVGGRMPILQNDGQVEHLAIENAVEK